MKKILSIAGIVCFSMLVAVGTHGIYSWFTDQSQRVNSFSVGMNEVEIREEFPDQELTPGKIIKKEAGFHVCEGGLPVQQQGGGRRK